MVPPPGPEHVEDSGQYRLADEGEFELVDAQRNKVLAKKRIKSHLTICRGKQLTA